MISEDLLPNREGNEKILIKEAPAGWQGTKAAITRIEPVILAPDDKKALVILNSDEVNLAQGQPITDADKSDILAFVLCENMFAMAKNVLNLQGIYVNVRKESIEKFVTEYNKWPGIHSFNALMNMWENWEQRSFEWQDVISIGKDFLKVYREADRLFQK